MALFGVCVCMVCILVVDLQLSLCNKCPRVFMRTMLKDKTHKCPWAFMRYKFPDALAKNEPKIL